MSVVDLEAGLPSEQSGFEGVGIPDDDTGCHPGAGNPEGVEIADHGFGDASEKAWEVHPTRSEQHVDLILERWKGNTESILLITGLLSATMSLFVIESYNMSLSPDVADVITRVISLDQPPLRLDAVMLEQSLFGVRATTIWLLSLGLNITCALWVLWRRWQQCIDPLGQTHIPARLHPHHISGIGTRFGKDHIKVEANWGLLHSSIILFLVGLVDFLFLINKTIAWILLGYLSPFAFLYAVATLLPYYFPKSLNLTLFPDWT